MLVNAHQNPGLHHILSIKPVEIVSGDAAHQQITERVVVRRQDLASALPFVIIVLTHSVCGALPVSCALAIDEHMDGGWEQFGFADLSVTVHPA